MGQACPGEGSCCLGNSTPGCADESCCAAAAVCAEDFYCCDVELGQRMCIDACCFTNGNRQVLCQAD